MPHRDHEDALRRRRYGRDSQEFARVLNLSDALFAIAMTLLVFSTMEASGVRLDTTMGAVSGQGAELIAFVVSFAVVANFWWVHHRFFAVLGFVEPGLIAINLALLGAVALVPYPTSLLGRDPTLRGTVVPYLLLLSLIAILHLGLLLRAGAVDAWWRPMPQGLFRWVVAGWGSSTAVTLLALAVSFAAPVAGLVMLLLTWPAEALVRRRAPDAYAVWG
ncbi:DUF1211 domain-containing protein [Nesterenkonia sp. LB17]|uniref:TMEM175 family protein n=1 Tax=unclassified Nesterenkonia TaxID=2629769 RepID=UPI001F4D2E3D|nr:MULTISPECIES: TMEM175 family protein [unclassified Nesterenkonia]MCH8562851.1 DUF1211 domain-containing protein [Nesterenkonia sp. YGD6]MCH8565900.1 DUF1211 domain-containing protein [Nesterenkonia sp. LB17]MCH8570692.1 DUF1211 domain-containing protein [Nesterenkonia sp. AY15]